MFRASPLPTINEIYAAFDPAMTAVFQAAIAASRNGIVRVIDLQAALAPHAGEFARDFLLSICCERDRSSLPCPPRPLTNEPALRELLQNAYDLAKCRSHESPTITPGVVLEITLAVTSSPTQSIHRRPLSGQTAHGELTASATCHTAAQRPCLGRDARRIIFQKMNEVFEQWLELKSLTASSSKQQLRTQLAALTAEIEELGWSRS